VIACIAASWVQPWREVSSWTSELRVTVRAPSSANASRRSIGSIGQASPSIPLSASSPVPVQHGATTLPQAAHWPCPWTQTSASGLPQ
jgi:hypothetical protein